MYTYSDATSSLSKHTQTFFCARAIITKIIKDPRVHNGGEIFTSTIRNKKIKRNPFSNACKTGISSTGWGFMASKVLNQNSIFIPRQVQTSSKAPKARHLVSRWDDLIKYRGRSLHYPFENNLKSLE